MSNAVVENALRETLPLTGAPVADDRVEALARFVELLDRWNRVFSLTAVRNPAEMVSRHILDSLSARPYLSGVSILDVGTGAGLPGLPLAVFEPQRQFVLLDSSLKKTRFVRHAAGELGLDNVTVEQVRVEDYAPADAFDTVVSRAFSAAADFVRVAGRLAADGGRLLAMKGRRPDEELRAVPRSWSVLDVEAVRVPGLDAARHIVVLQRLR